jgi:hypothetical protein
MMPYLLYWFDSSSSDPYDCVSLEPCSDFLSFAEGEEAGLDQIPKDIQQKIIFGQERSEVDQRVMNGLGKMQMAIQAGSPLPFTVAPDHDVIAMVRTTTASSTAPTPKKERIETTSTAASAPPVEKRTTTTSSTLPTPKKERIETTSTAASIDALMETNAPSKGLPSVGDRVSIWWEGMKQYYDGYVTCVRQDFYHILYDDSEAEWIPLDEREFLILPATENFAPSTIQAPPEEAEWLPPGYQQAKATKVQKKSARSDVNDDDMEWNSINEKKSTKSSAAMTKKGPSGSLTVEATVSRYLRITGGRVTSDGCIKPHIAPRQNPKGFYGRPSGRAPKGCTWNRRKGLWVPSILDDPVSKRKHDDYDIPRRIKRVKVTTSEKAKLSNQAAAVKNNVSRNPDADDEEASLFAQSTDGDWWEEDESGKNRSYPTPAAGQASSEGGARSVARIQHPTIRSASDSDDVVDEDDAANSMDSLEKELQTFGDQSSKATMKRVRSLLRKLNGCNVAYSQINMRLVKPVQKLRKHPKLGKLAKALIEKYRAAYYVELVGEWKGAVDSGDAATANRKLQQFLEAFLSSNVPISEDLVQEHDLRSLVWDTALLFDEKRVVCAELDALDKMLDGDLDDELEERALV